MKTKPYPHQNEAYDKGKDADIFALLADMGVGKSKVFIDICDYKYRKGYVDRVVVIGPSGVHEQWVDEQYPEHCSSDYKALAYTSKTTLKEVRRLDYFMYEAHTDRSKLFVFTINIESFKTKKGIELVERFFNTAKCGCAIGVDEASIIKTPDIVTVRNVKKLRDKYKHSFRCVMTGTPAAKGPVNLWSIFDFLKRNYMGCSYVAFTMMHSVIYKKKFMRGKQLVTTKDTITREVFDKVKTVINKNLDVNGKPKDTMVDYIRDRFGLSYNNFWIIANSDRFVRYKGLDKIQKRIDPDTFSVKKSDCLELPPKIYEQKLFKLNPHQKELIRQLEKYSLATYGDKEITLELKAMLYLRVAQICGGFFAHHTDIEGKYDVTPVKGKNAKLEFIKNDLEEVGDIPTITWAVYSAEIEMLERELRRDFNVASMYGNTNKFDRGEIVQKFKKGEIDHLVANPAVAGFGYNFQHAGLQYWYSRNFRTELRIQAEDRNYRIGTTKSPIYKDLLIDIPAELRILQTLKEEADVNEVFISKGLKDIFKLK